MIYIANPSIIKCIISLYTVLPQLNESLQSVLLIDIGQEEATTVTISSQIELGANRLHQVYQTE